jgi:hypothetical protein
VIDAIRRGLAERADPAKAPEMRAEADAGGAGARGLRAPVAELRGLARHCIEPNRGDREFFIRKAIGWALRCYAWVEPEAVIAYCDTHELSPLSRREALKNVGS